MSTTITERTITGRHPVTGEPIPVTLADDEDVVGIHTNGMPLVSRTNGQAGGTFGVTYLIDKIPYDQTESFDPLGVGVF